MADALVPDPRTLIAMDLVLNVEIQQGLTKRQQAEWLRAMKRTTIVLTHPAGELIRVDGYGAYLLSLYRHD